MTKIHVNLPDDLAKQAVEAAKKKNTSLDQFVARALGAQLSADKVSKDVGSLHSGGIHDQELSGIGILQEYAGCNKRKRRVFIG